MGVGLGADPGAGGASKVEVPHLGPHQNLEGSKDEHEALHGEEESRGAVVHVGALAFGDGGDGGVEDEILEGKGRG